MTVGDKDREAILRKVRDCRLFLSGPMTGYEDFNERAFVKAQICLKKLGADWVYNPIMQWIYEPQRISERRTHESYMLECIHELSRMDDYGKPYYHAVVQLDGWEASEGAMAEDYVARACGIPCISFSDIQPPSDDGDGDGGTGGDGTDGEIGGIDTADDGNDGADATDDGNDGTDTTDDGDGNVKEDDRDGSESPADGGEFLGVDMESDGEPQPKAALWNEWDDIRLLWEDVTADGHSNHRNIKKLDDLKPMDIATILCLQGIIEEHGKGGADVRQLRVIEAATCGMNAFVNNIRCDFSDEEGNVEHFTVEVSGPAIPNVGTPLSEQVWAENVVWEQL